MAAPSDNAGTRAGAHAALPGAGPGMKHAAAIALPDRRLRVFISSTIDELAPERAAARSAVSSLGLMPIVFEAGARPHPARDVYRTYLAESDVFVGIYWERYGWVAPGEEVSGLEDEWSRAADRPRLLYVKMPAPGRDPRLDGLISRIEAAGDVAYQTFSTPDELADLVRNDLAVLLSERFQATRRPPPVAAPGPRPVRVRPLGTAATPLVGRSREVDEVLGLLDRADVRLVTLTGPGGIGKTRVALEVAHRVSDGGRLVAWVGVPPALLDGGLVGATIAQALGIDERPADEPLAVVAEALRDAEILLVIDGFEPIVAAAPQLARLLAECPKVAMLVTSRSVLRLRAEHDCPIPPLDLPGVDDDGETSDAVRLFVAIATAADPSFVMTDENRGAVAAICRRLEGIPLAIELAAPRIRLLTPIALLGRLARRLDVLTSGASDMPGRHQTLRAALAWDYDLLDGDERALFRRLAVCVGGFGVDLAAAVAGVAGGLTIDVLDGLESLVGKSLVRHRVLPDGSDRFEFLDTVREYALDRLSESGEEELAREGHAAYVLGRLDLLGLHGRSDVAALDDVEREHDNVRAALCWAAELDDPGLELRLVARMTTFWKQRGHLAEGARWVTATIERTADAENVARVELLAGAAQFARARGEYATATDLFTQARDLAERQGLRQWIAELHRGLGTVLGEIGEVDAAREEDAASLTLYEELGDDVGRAFALNSLGVDAVQRGDPAGAMAFFRTALELALGRNRTAVAVLFMNMGCVLRATGRPDQARLLLLRSLVLWQWLSDTWYATDCLEYLSQAVADGGSPDDAVRLLGTADVLRKRVTSIRPPADNCEHETFVAGLRALLGSSQFDAMWEEGTNLSLDEALAAAAEHAQATWALDVTLDDADPRLVADIRNVEMAPA